MGSLIQESKQPHRFLEQIEFIKGRRIEGYEGLPLSSSLEDLVTCIKKYQIVVLVASDTNDAASIVPDYLHQNGFSKAGTIVCTLPGLADVVRMAAKVSRQRGFKTGQEVGYSVPFNDATSEATFIKYSTDEVLLRELLIDHRISKYSIIMVADAQERTVATDVLLSLLKDVLRRRKDLRLLISCTTPSAASKFSDYFDEAPVFVTRESNYPVDIHYTKAPEADYVSAAVVTALQVHLTEQPGDILIVFTGPDEVEKARKILDQRKVGLGTKRRGLRIYSLSENTPTTKQVCECTSEVVRKVILVTHMSENVQKLEGIKYVVDPGFTKMKLYDLKARSEYCIVTSVSKSEANARAFLSAKTSPGTCYRLYTAFSFYNLEEDTVPEIQRTDLAYFVLLLKRLGINDLVNYDFVDPPSAEVLMKSLENLYALMALNKYGLLVRLGATMSEFPLHPKLTRMVLASSKYKCLDDVLSIAAMLSNEDLIFYHSKKHHPASIKFPSKCRSDHIALLNLYNAWKSNNFSSNWCERNYIDVQKMKYVKYVRDQLQELLERLNIKIEAHDTNNVSIQKSITAGFCTNIAIFQKDGSYRKVNCPDTVLYIHPSSELRQELPRFVVFHETVFEGQDFMHIVTEIKAKCILEMAPHILLDVEEYMPGVRAVQQE